MKKIYLILTVSLLLFSFISCSADSSSSEFSDSEILMLASKAFTAASQAQLDTRQTGPLKVAAAPGIPVYYTLNSGTWFTGDSFNAAVVFDNYTEPDSGINFNGSIDLDYNSVTQLYTLTSSLDIIYEGESYNITFNIVINLDTGDYTGSVSVDGKNYTL